uniref:phage tail-collar fiber domain-containing protein n=1 Tax=Parasutterella excrementihominis TaxID=487175 RepID=UPI0022E46755
MPSVVVTSAGIAALLNAEQTGTLPVKITKFGLGTGNYTPTADKTALQSKFKEITALDGGAVGDNVIHVTMTDASSDAYTANEVGVYLEDGTLFALSSQPVGAILQKAAGSQALLSLDLVLQGGTGGVTVSGG